MILSFFPNPFLTESPSKLLEHILVHRLVVQMSLDSLFQEGGHYCRGAPQQALRSAEVGIAFALAIIGSLMKMPKLKPVNRGNDANMK